MNKIFWVLLISTIVQAKHNEIKSHEVAPQSQSPLVLITDFGDKGKTQCVAFPIFETKEGDECRHMWGTAGSCISKGEIQAIQLGERVLKKDNFKVYSKNGWNARLGRGSEYNYEDKAALIEFRAACTANPSTIKVRELFAGAPKPRNSDSDRYIVQLPHQSMSARLNFNIPIGWHFITQGQPLSQAAQGAPIYYVAPNGEKQLMGLAGTVAGSHDVSTDPYVAHWIRELLKPKP